MTQYQIQVRRDASTNWNTANTVLGDGEIGYDKTLGRIKIGDGATSWTTLNFPNWATTYVLNVQAYGAVGNGTTDDTAAIQEAIAACPAGGIVYFPPGIYLVSALLSVPDRVYLMGTGARDVASGSIIRQANGANLDAVIADHGWVNNNTASSTAPGCLGLIIDGNSANQTGGKGIGIVLMAFRALLRDNLVMNTYGDGIRLTSAANNGVSISGGSTCSGAKVLDNVVINPGTAGTVSNSSGIALRDSVAAVKNYWVERNYVSTATHGSGIMADYAAGSVVGNNHVVAAGKHGIYLASTSGTRVHNNYVESFGQLASQGLVCGVYALDAGDGQATVITGNQITLAQPVTGNSFAGIYLTNTASVAAYYGLGPNAIKSTGATTGAGVQAVNNGNVSGFVIGMAPQVVVGLATPYAISNSCQMQGDPFRNTQAVPFASTLSVDPTIGTVITITLTGNLVMQIPQQFPAGTRFTFIFLQDATGGRTVTWSNNNTAVGKWLNTTFAPTTAVNSASSVTFNSDGYNLVQE